MRHPALNTPVYVILDVGVVGERDILALTQALVSAGARLFQLRAKTAAAVETVAVARALTHVVDQGGGLLFVNDRLDVALASGAHGVHLGPNDLSVADAKRVAGSLIIGGSAANVARAVELQIQGADYLGCGAIYEARAMKPDASAPQGTRLIQDITRAVDVPVFGIGGINATNALEVLRAGATGVAVIRDILGAEDPIAGYKKLLGAITGCLV